MFIGAARTILIIAWASVVAFGPTQPPTWKDGLGFAALLFLSWWVFGERNREE